MKKIAFIGLDAAGKTSIITAITKKFGFEEEVAKLTPTRRISRDTFKFLGIEFSRLDFGGQRVYRDDYLKHPAKYLNGIDLIFYVIDAQDFDRYIESIDYLEEILLHFKEIQEEVKLDEKDVSLINEFEPFEFTDIYDNNRYDWKIFVFLFKCLQKDKIQIRSGHNGYRQGPSKCR